MHLQHRTRQFPIHCMLLQKRWINENSGLPIYPQCLADTWNQKYQGDARIRNDIAQAIDSVVSSTVRNEQGALVDDRYKACWIASWRNIQAVLSTCRQNDERRGFNKLPVVRMKLGNLLLDRGSRRCPIDFFQRL